MLSLKKYLMKIWTYYVNKIYHDNVQLSSVRAVVHVGMKG